MKKSFILLATVLSASILAGCGNNNAKDWTDEEKAMMTEHLGGNIIPYYYVEGQVVTDEYYEDYGCISVEAMKATNSDLVAYENILIAKEFTCETKVGSETDMPYYGSYYKECADGYIFNIQFYVGSGTKESGKYSVDAYYAKPLTNYSAEGLTSWADCATSAKTYFTTYGEEAPVLPDTLTTSATSFDMIDYRYAYYTYYGSDLGTPMALLYLNSATNAELSGVQDAFKAVGYVEKTSTDEEGTTSTYYYNDKNIVVIEYDEASGTYPEDISILIYSSEYSPAE